ncbi:MAG: outer membrane beta-barrel protein [Elusimicrobiota bacterium]|nr:outer membrane beta-barrel protein [Elusimicrobiota bacterium]
MRKLIAAVLILGIVSPASAGNWDWLTQYKRPNLHWGQLALHPYYKLTQIYDSNIYLVPPPNGGFSVGSGVRGSWITRNDLGLETVLPIGNLQKVSAGYLFQSDKYSTQPELNDTINQVAHLDYEYRGAYGLTARVGDRYENTTDQAFSQLVERARRWSNRAGASLDYRPENGRLAGGIDVSQTTHKYLPPAFARLLNRYEQRFGFNLGYMVMPKTKAYASYHRGVIHYTVGRQLPDQDKNSKSHNFGFGVEGQLTPKLEGRVETGMTHREYDEAPIGANTRTTKNLTVATYLTYKPQDRTTVAFRASRYLQESIFAGNRFYISNDVGLDVSHKLPYKFSVGGGVAFGLDKYPDVVTASSGARGQRRDDIYQGGAWLEYDIQEWLTTGISYVYRERNSTLPADFNYEDQRTAVNLALKF